MNMPHLSPSYRIPRSPNLLLRRQFPKRHSFRLFCLIRRRKLRKEGKRKDRVMKTELEMKNMRLYLENEKIRAENEKLRKKALLLHQENTALLIELHNKFSHTF